MQVYALGRTLQEHIRANITFVEERALQENHKASSDCGLKAKESEMKPIGAAIEAGF